MYNNIVNKGSTRNRNIWIIKPGENSNRGSGIRISNNLSEISKIVSDCYLNERKAKTFIIQKYIENPLLINQRKFDIRVFSLITIINNNLKGYFYKEGYIRTASKEFNLDLDSLDCKITHLTNEAIQKNSKDFGKFESGNKLSFADFQKYLDKSYSKLNINFYDQILSQIRTHVLYCFKSVKSLLGKSGKNSFEVLIISFLDLIL